MSEANKRQGKRWAAIGGALLIVVVVLVALLRSQHESFSARATRLEEHIACPVCVGEDVAHSNSSESIAIRQNIDARIRAGQSDSQILGYYAKTHPELMLSPNNSGLGLVAWGLPVVAVVLAIAGLGYAIARWKRQPRLVASDEDEALVERARRRPATP